MHSTNDSATTEFPWLNLDAKLYPEGRSRGLLVCGLEWGGEDGVHNPTAAREGQSFFSDRRERYPFRNVIISWFERWGHPLRDSDPGPFERSIVHMNWLPTKARKMKGRSVLTELLEPEHADQF